MFGAENHAEIEVTTQQFIEAAIAAGLPPIAAMFHATLAKNAGDSAQIGSERLLIADPDPATE